MYRIIELCTCLALALCLVLVDRSAADDTNLAKNQFLDLSLLVASDYPCTWASGSWTLFQMMPYRKIGPLSAYNSEVLIIDGNTGTQLDVPPHSIPQPDSKLPNANRFGAMFTDKVPAWQFGGEACVIDCRKLLGSAPKGRSDLVTRGHVMAWEKANRALAVGDVSGKGLGPALVMAHLHTLVRARLAPHKCPRTVRFCAELPKTATGKVQRFKLRDTALG